jgi:hypothetical protein
MKFPLPISMVISVVAGISEKGYEIYLNRSGINSIDLPREKILAEIGSNLRLKFLNRGAPIHITISSPNAGMFTDFFHENLYIVDEAVLPIPIRNESQGGFFDLEIIAGYGGMKVAMHVEVIHKIRQIVGVPEEATLHPVAHGRPHFLMIMMGIALVLYSVWLYSNIEFLNIASFIILITGALYTWYRQR